MLLGPEVLIVPDVSHAKDEPLQLDLFAPEPERRVLPSAPDAAAAVSHALEQGHTVKLRKSAQGFELHLAVRPRAPLPAGAVSLPGPIGETCGFSRRAVELLVRSVELEGRALWARPAGASWAGWAEWGTLPVGS